MLKSKKLIKKTKKLTQGMSRGLNENTNNATQAMQKTSKKKENPNISLHLQEKTLLGHSDTINAIIQLVDGRLASGSNDKTIMIWNTKTNEWIQTLTGHDGSVETLVQFYDGRLASGSTDHTIKWWNLEKARCLKTLKGHNDSVYTIIQLFDSRLASGSSDKTIKIWDIKMGNCLQTLMANNGAILNLIQFSDGRLANSGYGTIKLWDVKTARCLGELCAAPGVVSSMIQLMDGCLASIGGQELFSLPNSDGYYNKKKGRIIKLWDAQSEECLKTIKEPSDVYTFTQIVEGDYQYIVYLANFKLKFLDIQHGNSLKTLSFNWPYTNALIQLADGRLAIGGVQEGVIYLCEGLSPPQNKNNFNMKETSINSWGKQYEEAQKDDAGSESMTSTGLAVYSASNDTNIKEPQENVEGLSLSTIADSLVIPYEALTLGKKLGEGGFGAVFIGRWEHNDVAIKKLHTDKMSDDVFQEFKHEATLMAELRAPNIVQLYGICVSPHYCMVMELMPQGSLYDLLQEKNPEELSWITRLTIAKDMGAGLSYLHHRKIIHRDLKSLNVLLTNELKAKLADFGLATVKTETSSQMATTTKGAGPQGSILWMAPELFKRHPTYTPESDTYSYGVTLWELLTHGLPFSDAANVNLIINWVQNGEREKFPVNTPEGFERLITQCWAQLPENRPSLTEIMETLKEIEKELFPKKSDVPAKRSAVPQPSPKSSSGFRGNLNSVDSTTRNSFPSQTTSTDTTTEQKTTTSSTGFRGNLNSQGWQSSTESFFNKSRPATRASVGSSRLQSKKESSSSPILDSNSQTNSAQSFFKGTTVTSSLPTKTTPKKLPKKPLPCPPKTNTFRGNLHSVSTPQSPRRHLPPSPQISSSNWQGAPNTGDFFKPNTGSATTTSSTQTDSDFRHASNAFQ